MERGKPVAWINGRFVPLEEAAISIFDLGLHGVAVTEMLRTFGGRPFRLDAHLDRLDRSRQALGFAEELSRERLAALVAEVIERNRAVIPPESDLGINIVQTGGLTPLAPPRPAEPEEFRHTTIITAFPLPFARWAEMYDTGQSLVIPTVRQIPPDCVPPAIKSRNRLHWYLADRAASAVEPRAAALVLDGYGNIAETSAGNVFAVFGREVRTPPPEWILEGISRDVVRELCKRLGLVWRETEISPEALAHADEAFTSSSLYCLLPATRIDGAPVGSGQPGPVFRELVAAWNDEAGLDIIAQARRFATPSCWQETTGKPH